MHLEWAKNPVLRRIFLLLKLLPCAICYRNLFCNSLFSLRHSARKFSEGLSVETLCLSFPVFNGYTYSLEDFRALVFGLVGFAEIQVEDWD